VSRRSRWVASLAFGYVAALEQPATTMGGIGMIKRRTLLSLVASTSRYCFDAGLDEYCYWYPATDVVVTDTWVLYVPL
jgi:hypothetical protein